MKSNVLNHSNKKNTRKGFTLVELIVTMTLIAILAALSFVGILAWRDYIDFKRQNEYAQTLFVAAQNQLAEYSENGQLTQLNDTMTATFGGNRLNFTSDSDSRIINHDSDLTDENGYYTLDNVWPERADQTTEINKNKYSTDVYYLKCAAGEYAQYQEGNASQEVTLLFHMLESYVYDTSVLNGAICVEFTPSDGQVFAVLYSDKDSDKAFEYNHKNENRHGTVDISERTRDYRKKRMVGYYGVDTLTKANAFGRPVLSKVQLHNEETLNLSFELTKEQAAAGMLEYTVQVFDAETKKVRLKIVLNTLSGRLNNKDNATVVPCQVVRYDEAGEAIDDKVNGKAPTYDMMAWTEVDGTNPVIRLTLDAADVSAITAQYKQDYADLHYAGDNALTSDKDFRSTYSFHRFGIDFEHIYCTVYAQGGSYKRATEKKSNTEHAFFGSDSERKEQMTRDEDGTKIYTYTYELVNARHLYNIRYEEDYDLKKDSNGEMIAQDKASETTYELTRDIDWAVFCGDKQDAKNQLNDYLFDSTNTDKHVSAVRQNQTNDFQSIRRLRMNSAMTSGGNQKHTIYGLTMSMQTNYGARVVYDQTKAELEQLPKGTEACTFADDKTCQAGEYSVDAVPCGLFVTNYGTLTNFALDEIGVRDAATQDAVVGGEQKASDVDESFYVRYISDGMGAFCGENAGSLEKLETRNTGNASAIQGQTNVGGIAGKQAELTSEQRLQLYHTLNDENAQNKGKDANENDYVIHKVAYTELINRAEVSGTKYVGGIVGQLKAIYYPDGIAVKLSDTEYKVRCLIDVAVKDCKNYGVVEASSIEIKTDATDEEKESKPRVARYIGGIVGYSNNTVQNLYQKTPDETLSLKDEKEVPAHLTLTGCVSSPQYDNDNRKVNDIVKDEEKLTVKLNGVYVGGIVGYNHWAQLTACNTQEENGKEGYIFGCQYVGGIAGFNEGPAGAIEGKLNEKNGVNQANVIGETYVGGITGCNAATMKESDIPAETEYDKNTDFDEYGAWLDKYGIVQANETRKLSVKISDWTNEGIVVGRSDYVGGITGYNSGWLYNCNSDINTQDQTAKNITQASTLKGSYVGGIAGYNNGIIGNTERDIESNEPDKYGKKTGDNSSHGKVSAICYVTGTNYVGGIVGYNDVDAIVEDYELAGGNILGKGTFVGGYAGFNASVDLLMDTEETDTNKAARLVISSPNKVTGTYGVGGSIGGNIVSTDLDIQTNFKTDNFLGSVTGDAFVGGFVGYNRMVDKKSDTETAEKVRKDIKKLNDDVILYLARHMDEDVLEHAVGILTHQSDGFDKDSSLKTSDKTLTIQGVLGNNTTGTTAKFGDVTAGIYVGGAVGFNEENTKLTLNGVTNLTPVTANKSIEYYYSGESKKYEQPGYPYTHEESDDDKTHVFTYSYAGGIIGRAGKYVTLDNCQNEGEGDVVSAGTYTGGLCEVNEGTIQNCHASSIGSNEEDYVGGLTGLAKAGVIQNCYFDGTLTGRNYVGGFAAENYGEIQLGKDLDEEIDETQILYITKANINASGDTGNVGGLVGKNYASASVILHGGTLGISVNAVGGTNVGGIVGENQGKVTADKDSVTKLSGVLVGKEKVGGVVGDNSSKSETIAYFNNEAAITASRGNAGGIAGTTTANIFQCVNSGTIQATKAGNAGGIVADNSATVASCADKGEVSATNGICGGITAVNSGTVEKSHVSAEKTNQSWIDRLLAWLQSWFSDGSDNLTFTGKNVAGGICGRNNAGTIVDCSVTNLTVTNIEDSVDSKIGGIAGESSGTIQTCDVGESGTNVALISASKNGTSLGGVAGENTGDITGKTEDGYNTVYAKLSFTKTELAYYGNMGGVAGTSTGTIQNYEFNGEVVGTSNNPDKTPAYNPNVDGEANGAIIYGYGGIAGVNGKSDGTAVRGTIKHCKVNVAKISGLGDANNIVNVGGVAGVSGFEAEISDIAYGTGNKYKMSDGSKTYSGSVYVRVLNTANNDDTDTSAETGSDSLSYGHVGGVVGLNSGLIENIGYDRDSNKYSEDVDKYNVIVLDNRGHVGGIAGYNRKTGKIQYAATGSTWIVYAPKQAQDNGCGGIIGYNASEMDLVYCDNRATVRKSVGGSNAVGGMIGRSEVATSVSWHMSNCTNYGEIYGAARVGGMIGHLKYDGGIIFNCINYGTIGGGKDDSGGIIGFLYRIIDTPVQVMDCENHGTVNGSGIVGGQYNTAKAYIQVSHCVNTGLVSAGGGGIMGGVLKNLQYAGSYGSSYIKDCNNYGYAKGSKNLYGITTSAIKIENCLNLTNANNPISLATLSADKDVGNYYLSKKPEQNNTGDGSTETTGNLPQEKEFYVTDIKLSDNGLKYTNTNSGLYNLLKSSLDNGNVPCVNTGVSDQKPAVYEFTFNQAIDLTSIDFWLFTHNAASGIRQYTYTVYYYDENGNEHPWVSDTAKPDMNDTVNTKMDNDGKAGMFKHHKEGDQVRTKKVTIKITKVLKSGANATPAVRRIYFNGNMTYLSDVNDSNSTTMFKYEGSKGYWNSLFGYYGEYAAKVDSNIQNDGYWAYENATKTGAYLTRITDTDQAVQWEKTQSNSSNIQTTIDKAEVQKNTVSSTPEEQKKAAGKQVYVDKYQTDRYQLMITGTSPLQQIGLPGFRVDPYDTLFNDSTALTDANLEARGKQKNNIRYQVFDADNPYLQVSLTSIKPEDWSKKKGPVVSATTSDEGGVRKISWSIPADAGYDKSEVGYYEYEVNYYDKKQDDPDKKLLRTYTYKTYDMFALIPMADINGEAIRSFTVQVRAEADYVDEDYQVQAAWSEWGELWSKNIGEMLPTPKYHLEMNGLSKSDGKIYNIILGNQQEYEEFIQEQYPNLTGEALQNKITAELSNIEINVKREGATLGGKFTVADGEYLTSKVVGGAGQQLYTVQASCKAGSGLDYSSSLPEQRESMSGVNTAYTNGNTEANGIAYVKLTQSEAGAGFCGDTLNTLSYQLAMKHHDWVIYMRSEFMADDAELDNAQVCLSSSSFRVATTEANYISTSLSSLPADILTYNQYKNFVVRTYPAFITNSIVYMGRTVIGEDGKTSFTADELKKLYITDGDATKAADDHRVTETKGKDSEKLIITKTDSAGTTSTVAKGFVIERKENGEYSLYYNALLDYNNNNYPLSEAQMSIKTQVFYWNIPTKQSDEEYTEIAGLGFVETPDITIAPDAESGECTITWDQTGGKAKYDNAKYDYIVTGNNFDENPDGTTHKTSVQLDADTYESTKGGGNKLTYDMSSWHYDEIEVKMNRHGTVDADGFTTAFPKTATKTEPLKKQFSQIPRPTVTLHKKDDGSTDKNTLVYDITWSALPETERNSQDFAEYQVTTKGTATYDPDQLDTLKTLYASKPSVDVSDDKMTYTWTEKVKQSGEINDADVRKTVVLATDNDGNCTRELTEIYSFAEIDPAQASLLRQLDLNDYERNEKVNISVRAIAISSRAIAAQPYQTYNSGPAGVVRELTIPDRLRVETGTITSRPEWKVRELASDNATVSKPMDDADNKLFMTVDAFATDGITLTLNRSNAKNPDVGKYEIAVAIYDTDQEKDESKVVSGDAVDGDGSTQYWNSGAQKTLITKQNEHIMNGSLKIGTDTLKSALNAENSYELADYAGKWLKIAVRAISDSYVSSWWSDEDEATEATTNYQWIRIPRAQVETPNLTSGHQTLYYAEGGWDAEEEDTEDETPIEQTKLTVEQTKYADGYQLQLVHKAVQQIVDENLEDKYTTQYVDWMYLKKRADHAGYDVLYWSTDPKIQETLADQTEEITKSAAKQADGTNLPVERMKKIGTISETGNRLELPYQSVGEVTVDVDDENVTMPHTTSYVKLAEDNSIELVLPDVVELSTYHFTSQLSAQALVNGGTDEASDDEQTKHGNFAYYENSQVAHWYRTSSSSKTITLSEYDQFDAPTLKSSAKLSVQEDDSTPPLPTYALETTIQKQMTEKLTLTGIVYEVTLTDTKETEGKTSMKYYSVPVSENLTSGEMTAVWKRSAEELQSDLEESGEWDQTNKQLSVRVAYITSTNGLSQWTNVPPMRLTEFELLEDTNGTPGEGA